MENVATVKSVWRTSEQKIMEEFAASVRNTFKERVQRIVLYGSRARGHAEPDSDYDFVVLLEPFYESDKRVISDLDGETSERHGVLVTAFVIPLSDFREDKYYYFFENVCREGIDF